VTESSRDERIDALIAFAISLSGRRGSPLRSIGKTQLVKYVYLADLAHADERGETFTGAAWIFHNFGPWAPEIVSRIPTVAQHHGIRSFSWTAEPGEPERERWTGEDVELPADLRKSIPVVAKIAIERAVREFGADTASLLEHVYRTRPMLSAAPGERLSFAARVADPPAHYRRSTPVPVSATATKKRRELIERHRAKVQAAAAGRSRELITPAVAYDDRFAEVARWLDGQEGEPVPRSEGALEIGDSVWHSSWRRGDGLP
jgi:hypothetical protein